MDYKELEKCNAKALASCCYDQECLDARMNDLVRAIAEYVLERDRPKDA